MTSMLLDHSRIKKVQTGNIWKMVTCIEIKKHISHHTMKLQELIKRNSCDYIKLKTLLIKI